MCQGSLAAEAKPVPQRSVNMAGDTSPPGRTYISSRMFPYKDENPTELPAYVTIGIILLNVAVWLLVEGMGSTGPLARAVCQYGLVPGELLGRVPAGTQVPLAPNVMCVVGLPHYWTILTSMFTHGGVLHLIRHIWVLWVVGNDIGDPIGQWRFIFFYLL